MKWWYGVVVDKPLVVIHYRQKVYTYLLAYTFHWTLASTWCIIITITTWYNDQSVSIFLFVLCILRIFLTCSLCCAILLHVLLFCVLVFFLSTRVSVLALLGFGKRTSVLSLGNWIRESGESFHFSPGESLSFRVLSGKLMWVCCISILYWCVYLSYTVTPVKLASSCLVLLCVEHKLVWYIHIMHIYLRRKLHHFWMLFFTWC